MAFTPVEPGPGGVKIFAGRRDMMTMAGKVTVNFMPVVSDSTLLKVTPAEWNAGTLIECAIRELTPSADAQMQTDQWLCDVDQVETPGPTKHSLAPIRLLAGDPQNPDPWLEGLTRGQTLYLAVRPGIAHAEPIAADQRIRVWQTQVSSLVDAPYSANADGAKFEVDLTLAVQRFERNARISGA